MDPRVLDAQLRGLPPAAGLLDRCCEPVTGPMLLALMIRDDAIQVQWPGGLQA